MITGMRQRGFWIRLMAVIFAGLAVACMYPPFDVGALAWISLMPLLAGLWTLPGKRLGWRGFAYGWIAGTVSFGIQFNWLGTVSSVAAILVPMYLGCFWGLYGAFAATWGNPWRRETPRGTFHATRLGLMYAFTNAAVWGGTEWLRGWLFTGFGWNNLGVAFHDTLVIAQAADLLGVIGLSLLVVFFQALFVQAARRVIRGAADGRSWPRLDFAIGALAVGVVLCYGIVRSATLLQLPSERVRALLVQLNIPQEAARQLWPALDIHLAYEQDTVAALEALIDADSKRLEAAIDATEDSAEPRGELSLRWPDWVIWPETALTGRILRADSGEWGTWRENEATLSQVFDAGSFKLMFGVNELEAVEEGGQLLPQPNGKAYNSLAVIASDGELQTYRKRHLVLFGEYIPFVEQVPLLKWIYEQQSGSEYGGAFSRGESLEPLPVAVGQHTVGVIPTVCFEDSVPRLTRKFVRHGPQVIVNVTNDGWFKESPAAAQHFANAKFRAIELRRPMLRSANNGVSGAIDHRGSTAHPDTGAPQIIHDERGSHFTRGSLLVELDVPLDPPTTLYARIGDWGIIGLAFLGLLMAALQRPRNSQSENLVSS